MSGDLVERLRECAQAMRQSAVFRQPLIDAASTIEALEARVNFLETQIAAVDRLPLPLRVRYLIDRAMGRQTEGASGRAVE